MNDRATWAIAFNEFRRLGFSPTLAVLMANNLVGKRDPAPEARPADEERT